jgi:hypothetical protein
MRQPWLQATPNTRPDDFSPASATMTAGRAAWVVGLALVLFAAGRSGAILDAAYGLPVLPGTEALIVVAENWDGAMAMLGVTDGVEAARGLLGLGR